MTIHAPAEAAAGTDARTDLELLQGTWVSVFGRREAEMLIAGGLFTVRFADGDVYMGAFRLDPTLWPKAIDMRVDEGPAQHRGKIALCVYDLHGDALLWCPTEPGTTERLAAFPPENDPRYLYTEFRRVRPRPRHE
jgi:uncharacterized protein (TIGR03067 family)